MTFSELIKNPVLLASDNFTPLTRTPWAGAHIGKYYKNEVVPSSQGQLIGESWEFSCDPDFPSVVAGTNQSLIDFIATDPLAVLGASVLAAGQQSSQILIKLLNANEPLSLQVHPEDGDAALRADECGKPESWLVLGAEPGAGLYIGFSPGVSRESLKDVVAKEGGVASLLHFVEVRQGDYFEIAPGVPHAVGPGVTLLEPQRVLPGQRGKTYRLWDWNRRYNELGQFDQRNGSPRELHLDAGIKLVDPSEQVGARFVDQTRRTAHQHTLQNGALVFEFPANDYYQVFTAEVPTGARLDIEVAGGYGALLLFEGSVVCSGGRSDSTKMQRGQAALIPNASLPLSITADAYTELAFVSPAVCSAAIR